MNIKSTVAGGAGTPVTKQQEHSSLTSTLSHKEAGPHVHMLEPAQLTVS